MPLFKLCPAKFELQKDEENNNDETYLKSYNSSSSISSGHSTTEDNTSNNQVVIIEDDEEEEMDDGNIDRAVSPLPLKDQQQQSEFLLLNKFQNSLKGNIFKTDDTNTLSSSDESSSGGGSSIYKQDNNLIILEICVDCYQMMEGVTVNAENNDKNNMQQLRQETQSNSTTSSNSSSTSSTMEKKSSRKISSQKNFLKSIYLNKNASVKQNMPSSCSSDAIVMNSLSSVNIVNSVLPPDIIQPNNSSNSNKESPLLAKKSFGGKLQSHSTPSTSASNLGGIINKQQETELSHIVINDDEDESFSKKTSNIKVTREKLTLNLQPVYTSTTTTSS